MIMDRSGAGNETVVVSCQHSQLASKHITAEYPAMENRLSRLEVTTTQLDTRLARVEVTLEPIREDVNGLRADFRDLRNDMSHLRDQSRTDMSHLRDQSRMDFRVLFGAMISLALGMAALMARGFHWI
jgi:septal ring factor EnvC (AmiA/AmiB activator)